MKVITKCIINMKTLQIIKEESYEYDGEVALCGSRGGGGSSGGGAAGSGVVDYPDYMKTWHGRALDHAGVDTPTSSITDLMNAAFANDPFAGESAYDPDAELLVMTNKIASQEAIVNALNENVDWITLMTIAEANVLTLDTPTPAAAAEIAADVTAFGNELDAQIAATVYPRFEAGMRNINAVVSSAFVVGKSLIEVDRDRQVAKYQTKLRIETYKLKDSILATNVESKNAHNVNMVQQGTADMLTMLANKIQFQQNITHLLLETNRVKITAKKEETDGQLEIDESSATWDLSVYQHGSNLLASIAGGVSSPEDKKKESKPSVVGPMISGALSGAVAGAVIGTRVGSVGGGYGALAGAVVGAAAGYFMA